MKRSWAAVFAAAAVVVAAVLFVSTGFSADGPRQGLHVGNIPPDFSATDLSGGKQSLAQYRDKIVVLHFWASWCPYCRGEMPKLIRIHNELGQQGVKVLAVSVDEDTAKLSQLVASAKVPYAVIPDIRNDLAIAADYRVYGIPVTYVIGRNGQVTARFQGPGDLFEAVKKAVDKSPLPS